MNEHLLQYIWLHRLYDVSQLKTTDQQPVFVIHQGQHNKDQGPDFLHARIRVNNIELIGSVEIHTHTSHWYQHGHTGDAHYGNVVLHVVWEHDADFDLPVPVLILKGRVASVLLNKYGSLSQSNSQITCAASINKVPELILANWKERMMAERLTLKMEGIQKMLLQVRQNEEEVFWWMMFRTMGLPVNADAFEAVFRSIPFRILLQSSQRIQVAEALLLGQAGLLDESFEEDYLIMLQKEFNYLQRKHGLHKPAILLSYLRMRPAHFPSIRLAQLAMLLHTAPDLFRRVLRSESLWQMKNSLAISANDFWHHHYALKHKSPFKIKQLGSRMTDLLLINTILPFRYLQAAIRKDSKEQMHILEYYHQISPEKNTIVDAWKSIGITVNNAFDAQALLHLKKNYCTHKRCLECAIGNHILKIP